MMLLLRAILLASFDVLSSLALTSTVVAQLGLERPAAKHSVELQHSLDHFIVVPEHKLLFCYIEKVGCTSFNNVFRFLRSRYEPTQAKGSVWARNTPSKHNITRSALQDMLMDKSWHKAVFYREPMERYVSAYKSKCEGADWRYGRAHCTKMFGNESVPFNETIQWIQEFDRLHHGDGTEYALDEHFRLQSDFCGGLTKTLQYYDTVEELHRDTAHSKVTKLLEKVGVKAQSVPHFDDFFPPAGDDAWQERRHNTNSGNAMDDYFSHEPSFPKVLMSHYRRDYDTFGIEFPSWASESALTVSRKVEGNTLLRMPRGISGPFLGAASGEPMRSRWPLLDWPQVGDEQEAGLAP